MSRAWCVNMLKDQIEEVFTKIKTMDPKVISLIVTDDSGLVIYSSKKTNSIELLSGTITAILKKTKKILQKFGNNNLKELTIRIEDYQIKIIPRERTITILIRKK